MTDKNENKRRAHGQTFKENKALQRRQKMGEVVMVEANSAQKFQDEIFEKDFKGFKIPEHDQHCYHVAMEARTFSQDGRRLSKGIVQVFNPETYKQMRDAKPYSGFHGFVTHILHNPSLTQSAAAPAPTPPAGGTGTGNPGVGKALVNGLKEGADINVLSKADLQLVANFLGIELKKSWKLDKIREVIMTSVESPE